MRYGAIAAFAERDGHIDARAMRPLAMGAGKTSAGSRPATFRNQQVSGSSPLAGSNIINNLQGLAE